MINATDIQKIRTKEDIINDIVVILTQNNRMNVALYNEDQGDIYAIKHLVRDLSSSETPDNPIDLINNCILRYKNNNNKFREGGLDIHTEENYKQVRDFARRAAKLGYALEKELQSLIKELAASIDAENVVINANNAPSPAIPIDADAENITIEEKIRINLESHSDYPDDFKDACNDMIALAIQLKAKKHLSDDEYNDLMGKTNSLINNPAEYKSFFAETKNYRMIEGGRLFAFMMLVAGWAAKIMTFNILGDVWIEAANLKLDLIRNTERLTNASDSYSSGMQPQQ